MRLGVKVSSLTARQLDSPRQNSTDLNRAEPIRTSLLEPHSFKVKVDGDPLVNYTTWWLDDGFTSGGPFVPRVGLFVRALFDLNLIRIALRLHFLVLKPVARKGFRGVFTKNNCKESSGYVGVRG